MACLLLSACSSAPDVVYKTVSVSVPVQVPCVINPVYHPVWPTQQLAKNATFFEKVRAIVTEMQLRRSYELKLEAAVKSCQ
jgi:hypothetical protein